MARNATLAPAQPNQSLHDGLRVLQLLCESGPIGSRDCARRLGLEATRANRLLKTMASTGVVRQRENRKYEPGPALQVMAARAAYESRLMQAADTLETLLPLRFGVAMGVMWRGQVCRLHRLGTAPHLEPLVPADQSAIGLALADPEKPFAFLRREDGSANLGVIVPNLPPVAGIELIGRISKLDIPRLLGPLQTAARAIANEDRRSR